MRFLTVAAAAAMFAFTANTAFAACDDGEVVIKFSHVTNADKHPKGIAASLLTASLEALIAGPIEQGVSPEDTCRLVSRLLYERTTPEKYATGIMAVLGPGHVIGEQCQVCIDLGNRWKFPDGRILAIANGRERDPGNLGRPWRFNAGPVDQRPQQQRQQAHRKDDRQGRAIHQLRSLSHNPLTATRTVRSCRAGQAGIVGRFKE